MKLRINAKLRAALIAAISTVGFTLTQAQAATLYTQPNFNDGSASGQEYIWVTDHWELNGERVDSIVRPGGKGGVMVIDNAGTVSNPVGVADTSDAGGVKVMGNTTFTTSLGSWAGSIFVEAAAVLNASYGASLKNTEAETAANVYVDGTLNITGRNNLDLNDGKNYQNWYIGETGFINLSGITSVSKGNRAWNIQLGVDEGEPVSLDGYTNRTRGGQLTKKFMSTGADLYGQVASFAVFCDGVEMDSSKYTINHNASGMSVTFDAATAISKMSLTWAGGEAAWEVKGTNWTDAAGTTTSFANGDDVTFTGSGNKANVVGAIETGAITVNGGTTIDTTADGASLAADSLTMGAGGSLTLAGTAAIGGDITVNGAATIDATADGASLSAGSLTIGAGSSLAFAGTAAIAGAVSVADANALVIGTDSTLKVTSDTAKALIQGTQVANSGTLAATGGMSFNSSATTQMGGTLAIAAGQKLTIGTNKDNQSYNFTSLDALVLGQGANIDTKALKVDIKNLTANGSTLNMQDTYDTSAQTVGVNLQGTTKLAGDLTITSGWKYKINIDKLEGTGTLKLTGGSQTHNAVIGDANIRSINVTDKMNNVEITGTVILSETLAVNGTTNVTGTSAMTLAGLTGSAALNVAGGITFTGAGEYSYTGTLAVGGQIVKQGTGTQTISGYAMHRAIDVQAGTLALTGTYAIDAITDGETTNKYYDYTGAEGDNGFHLQSGSITVYKQATEGATVNTANAHFTYGAQDVTASVIDDGIFDIPAGDPNYTTYHLNAAGASVDVAAAYTHSQQALTTVNVLGATGTLTTDTAVSLTALHVASGSTAAVSGEGTLSVTALDNSGTVNVDGSLAVANPLNLSSSSSSIHVLDGGVLTIASNSKVDGAQIGSATGEQTNGAFTKVFKGQALDVQEGGKLVLNGNVVVCDTQSGSGEATMVSGISELEIQGGFQINTYAVNPGTTWQLGGHTMRATDYLWLTNHQFLTVEGGTVESGELRLGHDGNTVGGSYPAKLTATDESSVILGGIAMYGGHNEVNIDGSTLTFTKAEGNVLRQAKNQPSAAADLNKVVFNNTKLVADTSSWTLAPINGTTVTMTGANTIDVAAEKTITLTVTALNGAITKTGAGALVFTAAGESTLTDSIKVQQGALTLSGTYVIDNITAGTVVEKFVDTTGAENPNGGFYQQSGTKTVYTVAEGIASINVAGAQFTYGGKDVTASVVDGSYELPADPIKTTLWVNSGELAYDDYYAASDGALTTAKVAGNATLTVGTNAVGTLEYQTNGSTITLAGTGTVNAISGTGILNMAADAHVAVPSLTVNSAKGVYSTGAGTLALDAVTISGSGSIEFDSSTEIGTTHLTGGSITFGGTDTTHKLTDLGLSQGGGSASTVNVKAGTTVHIVGTTVAKDRDSRFMGSFSLSHWNANNTVNVYGTLISDVVVSSCDGKGIINVESGGRLEMRDGLNRGNYNDNAITFNVKSGATLAAGTTHNTTETKNSNNVVVNLEGGSTFEAYYGAQDTTAVINKVLTFGEGTITMNAGAEGKTLQLNSNIAGEGVTIAKTGAGELALNGNANVLYNTIDLRAGSIALNGTFDASHIDHVQGTVEYYATPDAQESSANGFAKYTGTAQLVNANYGNVTVGDNAVITLDGYAVGYNTTTGKVGGTISLATYYINRDSERLSVIQGIAPNAGVALADGAKLVVDADLSAALTVAAGGKGYVEISEGQLLHSTTAAVELSGSGTYALASGSPNMGNVTLDATNWTGIVMVSGWSQTIFDYATGLSTANSYVGMNGVTGVDSKWNAGDDNWQTLNFYLEDPDGGVAWNWNNGAGGGATARFAGKMAGSGTLKKTDGSHSNSFYFKGDVSEWTGRFEVSGESKSNAFVQFTGDATNIAVTVVNSSDKLYGLQIINDSDVTMSGDVVQTNSGTIALTVGADTTFSREVDSVELSSVHVASLTVNAGKSATFLGTLVVDGAVNVGEGSTLTLSGDTTINQAITSTGTVEFNQNLAVSGFEVFADAGYIDYDGSYSATGNGFTGVGDSYITLVSGGTVVGNIDVTQGVEQEAVTYHLTNSGNAVLADSHHATEETTYHLNSGDVNISTITAAGATAIAVTGGTLVVDQDASAITIDVTGEGTISDVGGHVSPTQVGIAAKAEATFEQGIDDTENGVRFSSDEGGVIVKNTNGELGGEDIHYSIGEASAQVTADKLTFTGVAPTTVANQVVVDEIVNESGSKLTLENAESMELKSMTISNGSTVEMLYTDETAAVEGTVTITESLVAGGGTLLADLTLVGHELGDQTPLLRWNLNGQQMTLGSTLTLDTESGLIQLDDATMQQIANLTLGENWELVVNGGAGLQYDGNEWFDGVFSRTYTNVEGEQTQLGGDYKVQLLDSGNFGVVKYLDVPEPTTGTLSLLALAALAARRRRK